MLTKYKKAIESINNNIFEVVPFIKDCKGTVYLTGIGKCEDVCRKCSSTWKSLGILCNSINVTDMIHGSIGILRNEDIIIYISKSGKTPELINFSKYISENFTRIFQFGFTMSLNYDIILNKHIFLEKVEEIDYMNIIPTTSCAVFMIILDMIGISVFEFKLENFKKNHPGGNIGQILK